VSYAAEVLADSIGPDGTRIITVQSTFPRFILAEVNTHRVFSRNSASSRAIPPNDVTGTDGKIKAGLITRVMEHPFVPETFNRRVKGMGVGEELAEEAMQTSRRAWLHARDKAVQAAQILVEQDVDKSRVNRLLEPFMWHTAIITSTEWDNFRALRQPMNSDAVPQRDFPAQPEFQIVARMVCDVIDGSTPRELKAGQWHLPKVSDQEMVSIDGVDRGVRIVSDADGADAFFWPHVSSGRCARVSFDTQDNYEEPQKSYGRSVGLTKPGHWSPLEHPARPISEEDIDPENDSVLRNKLMIPVAAAMRATQGGLRPSEVWCGNVRGWVQLRKLYEGEEDHTTVLKQSATA
jgi:hypothetical protein